MAPTAPTFSKPKTGKAPSSHRPNFVASETFSSTKKDKRQIKHSLLISRIEKSHAKPLKRRRPNKKLVTTLESLGDALDGLIEDGGMVDGQAKEGKIRMKGLKSRPGATKRKEKLERKERERFGKNLDALNAGMVKEGQSKIAGETMGVVGVDAVPQILTSSRWAALRGFITQTMEQKEEFAAKSKA